MPFTRITVNAEQMGGVPCIRGLRIPVATVVGMVAERMTEPEILAAYPDLQREDIGEALRYAAAALTMRDLPIDHILPPSPAVVDALPTQLRGGTHTR